MPNVQIPSFVPFGLGDVPEGADWFTFRDKVIDLRADITELTENGDEQHPPDYYRNLELRLCSEDIARWIALWLYIEEPRLLKGEEPIKPFVPFAYQVELAQWFVEKTSDPEPFDGFMSKARGLGVSWIFCAAATWAYLFTDWRGILISRKEDLVDKKGDLNSLFGKIDFILESLPEWMLPEGFNPDLHRQKNLLIHPHSNAVLIGESTTTKASRGGRATFMIYDEAAFIKDFMTVFGTGSGTTNHRWSISSESFEEGDDWWKMWNRAKEVDPSSVRELEWPLNPYFDENWFRAEKQRWEHDPEGFEREYLRNPFVGTTWIYPTVRNIKTFDDEWYDEKEILLVGIDPGRADDTAIVFMQFYGDEFPRRVRWIDSYSSNLKPAEYYAHILTGIEPQPGDPAYGETFDNYALDHIMPWMRSLPWQDAMRVFCDPAGSQKDMSGKSFIERIIIETKRLRARHDPSRKPVPIVPIYQELFAANRHDKRRLELRTMLLRSSFSNTRGARALRYALQEYRFSEPTGKSTSQPAPLHDAHSHLCSAAEYIAVYCSIGLGKQKARRERRKKTRVNEYGQRTIEYN